MADFKKRFFEAAKNRTNGCPLFENREKGEWDDLEDQTVTLQRAYPLTGEDGQYFAVWFEEDEDNFYLTPRILTDVLTDGQAIASQEAVELDEVIAGLQIKVGPEKKTKNGKGKYRSMEVIG